MAADSSAPAPKAEAKASLGALQLWSGVATMIGLASDFMRPIGPFALIIFVIFLLATLGLLFGGRAAKGKMPWASQYARYSLVGAVVFGLVVVLQMATSTTEAGEPERGFVASVVPPLAGVQAAVLDVEAAPADEFEAAMRSALKEKDETERRSLARKALTSEDAGFRQTATEKFYLDGDPVLRRQAVIGIFASRRNDTLPVVVIESESNDPELAKRLIGKGLYIYSTDTEVGSVSASFLNARTSGTIALTGINFSVGNTGTLRLAAADDFTLKGTYEETSGAKADVQILLN